MTPSWTAYLPGAIAAVALIFSLMTGKAFNPLRGTRPAIVNRMEQPTRYWASVMLCAVFVAVWCWMIWPPNSN